MTTEISTTVTIEKVATVPGRDGPQWELQVKWPWSTRIPDKLWLDKKSFPTEPMAGTWPVQVEKRGVKRKADGSDYDGSQGWMYNYRLISFGGPGAGVAPPASPPARAEEPEPQYPAPPAAWRDPKGASIERQVALKAAVDLAGFKIAAGKDIGAREVMQVASLFDRWLGRNFDLEAPQDASTAPATGRAEEEATEPAEGP